MVNFGLVFGGKEKNVGFRDDGKGRVSVVQRVEAVILYFSIKPWSETPKLVRSKYLMSCLNVSYTRRSQSTLYFAGVGGRPGCEIINKEK